MLKFRFVCLKSLNPDSQDCADFEARFCCPKQYESRKRRADQNISRVEETETMLNSTTDLRKLQKYLILILVFVWI